MSSTYRRICLSHEPPLVVDEDVPSAVQWAGAPKPPGHPQCVIGIGRWSGDLIEVWLPIPFHDKVGAHTGAWFDVSWLRRFPAVAHFILDGE